MIVTHLEPPYFAVISPRFYPDETDYQSTAMRMKELAEQQEGYLGMESAKGDLGLPFPIGRFKLYYQLEASFRAFRS